MIDEENDFFAVSSYFSGLHVSRKCYGNGISVWNDTLGPNVRASVAVACRQRIAHDGIRFIYVWTVNDEDLQHDYINLGVDGIITDDVKQLAQVVAGVPGIRMATRSDNPFLPSNAAYLLTVQTENEYLSGPNQSQQGGEIFAQFTLVGESGSTSVDATLMFLGSGNLAPHFVILPSRELGLLKSIEVSLRTVSNALVWTLGSVTVESDRYAVSARADFHRVIAGNAPFVSNFN